MNKISIIIRREVLNIVGRKAFWIATFLLPLGMVAFFAIEIAALTLVEKNDYKVLIPAEKASIFGAGEYRLLSSAHLSFEVVDEPMAALQDRIALNKNELLIDPPQQQQIENYQTGTVTIYSNQTVDDAARSEIKRQVEKRIREYRMQREGMSQAQLDKLDFDVSQNLVIRGKDGEKRGSKFLGKAIGFGICFIIYMMVAIYGSSLMQTVIEEKNTRIVEVIASSVRPFQLLMGKTIAMASVAMLQMLIWGVLLFTLNLIAMPILMSKVDPAALQQAQGGMAATPSPDEMQSVALEFVEEMQAFNWSILWWVPLFFIGGFFLYGSLYAAVGSTVDNIQDAQQFAFPITLPLILGFFAVFQITQNPNSALGIFASHFPFFSPMAMPARMAATDVPWYEVLLSLSLLIAGFVGSIWLAGRIYRTGILMYGKKPTFREIFRWVRA